jgi:hypothetical protein
MMRARRVRHPMMAGADIKKGQIVISIQSYEGRDVVFPVKTFPTVEMKDPDNRHKKIYKVHVSYKDGCMPTISGHWIRAAHVGEAVRTAKKYKIGYPMGRVGSKYRMTPVAFDPEVNYRGKVWEEVDGALVGYETPFRRKGEK